MNVMEQDPDKINDQDRYIESKILEAGQAYADSNKRQKKENKARAENRAKIKDLGVRTDAYQTAVRICKDLTESERSDFLRDLELLVRVLGPRQRDFFEDEAIKAEKREQKRRDAEAAAGRTQAELDAATDSNPKSDPASGGAGKKPRKKKGEQPSEPATDTRPPEMRSSDPVIDESLKGIHEQEQADGAAVLDGAIDGIKKSQSQKSAEALEAAKLT